MIIVDTIKKVIAFAPELVIEIGFANSSASYNKKGLRKKSSVALKYFSSFLPEAYFIIRNDLWYQNFTSTF